MVAFSLFVLVPVVGGLLMSFVEWDLFSAPQFVGWDNYRRLLTDPSMWASLWVSAQFVALGVIPVTIIGFVVANLLNVTMRGIGFLRLFYLLPLVASSAVAATIWGNLYQPQSGFINQVLGWFGVDGPDWLTQPGLALPSLVVIMIWGALPLVALLYLAGLQRISDDIYAAAALDGAGRWTVLWQITWPNVWPTTAVILVLQLIGFLGGSLELALILTEGGPLNQTRSLALYAYQTAFNNLDIGYASALSFFQLLLVGALFIVGLYLRRISRRGVKG